MKSYTDKTKSNANHFYTGNMIILTWLYLVGGEGLTIEIFDMENTLEEY